MLSVVLKKCIIIFYALNCKKNYRYYKQLQMKLTLTFSITKRYFHLKADVRFIDMRNGDVGWISMSEGNLISATRPRRAARIWMLPHPSAYRHLYSYRKALWNTLLCVFYTDSMDHPRFPFSQENSTFLLLVCRIFIVDYIWWHTGDCRFFMADLQRYDSATCRYHVYSPSLRPEYLSYIVKENCWFYCCVKESLCETCFLLIIN